MKFQMEIERHKGGYGYSIRKRDGISSHIVASSAGFRSAHPAAMAALEVIERLEHAKAPRRANGD
ncbi:hypothetical protein [Tardiphaga sp. P5_C7]